MSSALVSAAGFDSAAGAAAGFAPGFAPVDLAAGFAAAGEVSAASLDVEAALAPGLAPGLAAVFAPGLGAPGFAAGFAPGLAAGFVSAEALEALSPLDLAGAESANASFTFRTTGASRVEEAERTNSPRSWSFSRTFLLVVPSSFASSWTRGFATVLLSGFFPGQERTSSMKSSSHFTALSNSDSGVIARHSQLVIHSGYPLFLGSVSILGRSEAVTFVRKARAKDAAVNAFFRHVASGCTQAPRPGSVADTSWTMAGC